LGTVTSCWASVAEQWERISYALRVANLATRNSQPMGQTQFELRRKLLQLEALYDIGRALNTLRPEGELLEELMQRAISVLDATSGFVFSLDEKLNVHQVFSFGHEAPPLSDGAVKQAMTTRTAIAAGDQLLAPM